MAAYACAQRLIDQSLLVPSHFDPEVFGPVRLAAASPAGNVAAFVRGRSTILLQEMDSVLPPWTLLCDHTILNDYGGTDKTATHVRLASGYNRQWCSSMFFSQDGKHLVACIMTDNTCEVKVWSTVTKYLCQEGWGGTEIHETYKPCMCNAHRPTPMDELIRQQVTPAENNSAVAGAAAGDDGWPVCAKILQDYHRRIKDAPTNDELLGHIFAAAVDQVTGRLYILTLFCKTKQQVAIVEYDCAGDGHLIKYWMVSNGEFELPAMDLLSSDVKEWTTLAATNGICALFSTAHGTVFWNVRAKNQAAAAVVANENDSSSSSSSSSSMEESAGKNTNESEEGVQVVASYCSKVCASATPHSVVLSPVNAEGMALFFCSDTGSVRSISFIQRQCTKAEQQVDAEAEAGEEQQPAEDKGREEVTQTVVKIRLYGSIDDSKATALFAINGGKQVFAVREWMHESSGTACAIEQLDPRSHNFVDQKRRLRAYQLRTDQSPGNPPRRNHCCLCPPYAMPIGTAGMTSSTPPVPASGLTIVPNLVSNYVTKSEHTMLVNQVRVLSQKLTEAEECKAKGMAKIQQALDLVTQMLQQNDKQQKMEKVEKQKMKKEKEEEEEDVLKKNDKEGNKDSTDEGRWTHWPAWRWSAAAAAAAATDSLQKFVQGCIPCLAQHQQHEHERQHEQHIRQGQTETTSVVQAPVITVEPVAAADSTMTNESEGETEEKKAEASEKEEAEEEEEKNDAGSKANLRARLGGCDTVLRSLTASGITPRAGGRGGRSHHAGTVCIMRNGQLTPSTQSMLVHTPTPAVQGGVQSRVSNALARRYPEQTIRTLSSDSTVAGANLEYFKKNLKFD